MSNPTANHFELLDSLEIFYEKGKVDVTDAFFQMSVTEDLFKNSVSCTLDLIDSVDSLGIIDWKLNRI